MRTLSTRDQTALAHFGSALLAGQFAPADTESDGCAGRAIRPEAALEELHTHLPARLPPLYQRLILEYYWPELKLGELRLLANPAGRDLRGLLLEMKRDRVFWTELLPRGWIQIGKGPDLCYDPVCFDIRRRTKDGDYRVVQLDHEALLCNLQIREVAMLAPTFRELLEKLTAPKP